MSRKTCVTVGLPSKHSLFRLHRAGQDLIRTPVADADRVRIRGSIDRLPHIGRYLGVPACRIRLENAALMLKRSDEHEEVMALWLSEMQKPAPKIGRSRITADDLSTMFGLSPSDIGKITDWMQSQYLDTIRVSASRTAIGFSGDLLAVEAAFRTEFQSYRFGDRDYLANAFELSVPAAFAGVVSGVSRPAWVCAALNSSMHRTVGKGRATTQ